MLAVTGGHTFSQTSGTTTVQGALKAATIDIAGGVLAVDTANFTNTGAMIAAGGGKIDFSVGGLTNLSGTTLSGGSFTVDAGSILQLPNNAEIATLAADLTLSGLGSVVQGFNITSNTEVTAEITLRKIAASGSLNVLGGRDYTTTDAITDAGSLTVGRGSIFTAAALTVASGGSLDVVAGAVLNLSSPLTIAGTATNAGRINGAGAIAVSMAGGTGKLILAPSFAFGGTVSGGGNGSALELAKGSVRGILNGIGTGFTNFGTVTVDPGAAWMIDVLATALPETRIRGSGGSNVLTLTSAGAMNLASVTGFPAIRLAAGDSTVTVTDATLRGGAVTITSSGAGDRNNISAAHDTAASAGKTLHYTARSGSGAFTGGFENDLVDISGDTKASIGKILTFTAGSGTATFTGGFENDVVKANAAAIGRDTLSGGSGKNRLNLTSAGKIDLSRTGRFGAISLAAGNNTVTVFDKTLSGRVVTITGGATGSNSIDASGDTRKSKTLTLRYITPSGSGSFTGGFENDVIDASGDGSSSAGETLTFIAGSGNASFTGGFENDVVQASAAAVSRDILIGGRGSNGLSLKTAGAVNLADVENFRRIDLAAGNNTVTVTNKTLRGGAVTIVDGTSGNNIVSAAGDGAASKGETLTYVAGIGTVKFTGGFENDVVKVSAATIGGDTLSAGSGRNTLDLTSVGSFSLDGAGKFRTINLAAGNNKIAVTDNTLSGGRVTIRGSTGSDNIISAVGDTKASSGNTLSYVAKSGAGMFSGGFENDVIDASGDTTASIGKTFTFTAGSGKATFTGGFENDVVKAGAGAVSRDTLTGGSGENTLDLTGSGTFDPSRVANFGTIKLAPGNNTVTVTDSTLSGGAVTIIAGTTGNDIIIVADSAASRGKTLTYVAAGGIDTFIGGFEDDTVQATAAAVGRDSLVGDRGSNTLDLLTAGAVSLADVKNFRTINLASGSNMVTVVDNTLSGGKVTIRAAAGGNNISAAGDTVSSSDKTLTYVAAGGADKFTGGFENDVVRVSVAAVGGDTLTGGSSGSNTLELTSAGTIRAGGVTGIEIFALDNGPGNVLHLASTNFAGIAGNAITVDGGSKGNEISEKGVAARDRVVMRGGAGVDTLIAGPNAEMAGADGKDLFELTTAGSAKTPDTNTIDDFGHNTDKLAFSEAGFSLGPNPVAATLFTSNPTGSFTAPAQRFAYDTTNGRLFYDADGSGHGSARELIATLSGQPNLTASDIAFAA